ncbi:gliding motility protein [Streptomyces sp. enrichment culture]|uniref:gliding motility protein n=1 Tax=Streptomyces sp. enrichment culture TaxID=1795815 RepID=UPI003F575396
MPAAEARADAPALAQAEGAAAEGSDGAGSGPAVTEAAGDAGPESVDIPQQQSAGKAADNEAGEGART